MSDVRWEPVGDGTFVKCNHPGTDCDDFVSVHMTGPSEFAIESSSEECDQVFVWLPPDVRLCRAVPVTWSKEPPDEDEIAVWLWHPELGVAKGVVYWDTGIPGIEITGGPFIECAEMPEAWYALADVPQPPTGGIGP